MNLAGTALIFLSALTVIVGDSIIKKVSSGTIMDALRDPWMLVVYALYFVQILFAIYIFVYKGELTIYTTLYVVFYSILGVLSGILIFKESLSAVKGAGIILAVIGAVLMSL